MAETSDTSGQENMKDIAKGNATGGSSLPGKSGPAKSSEASVTKKTASGVGRILFNLVIVAGIATVAYFVYEQNKAVNVLFEQQNSLSSQRNDAGEQLKQLQNSVQALGEDVGSLDAQQNQITAENQNASARFQQQLQMLAQQQAADIERLQNELVSTRLRISASNSGASQQWLLTEAASLLRLAQQQLIIARNMRTAQALYLAADDVLKQIDDPAVFAVRDILAGELAAIRAVPEVDVQAIYLQLGTLSSQLSGFQVSNDLAAQLANSDRVALFSESEQATTAEESGLLAGFFTSMKNLLDRFLVIRRRDEAIQALMTPGQEAALLQTTLLQIEQGKTALLKQEQEIYSGSLAQARSTIAKYLVGEPALKAAILSNLDDLAGRRIVTEPPSLVRTRAALEQILLSPEQQATEAVIQ